MTAKEVIPGTSLIAGPPGRRFQAIKEHLFCELDGKAVILSLKNGKYYGFNPVGTVIWMIIQEPVTLAEIESSLMQKYSVGKERCHSEVTLFIENIANEQLVEVNDE